MIDEEEFIATLYRGILSREPDRGGFETHLEALHKGERPEAIARRFIQSTEFAAKITRTINLYPLDRAAPMSVDLDLTADQEQALWDHVRRIWSKMGDSDPYFSVITIPKWKIGEMQRAESLDAFYATGESALKRLDSWFERNRVSLPSTATCVELGCGVGRCTIWLARRYARVIAIDISEPHLRLAQAKADAEGLNNIEFVHLKSKDDIANLRGVDLFYSHIVLQHNPPPLIVVILKYMFANLRVDGLAHFQVPTYRSDYSFNLRKYLNHLSESGMEMHFVPQSAIFDVALAFGMKPLEALPDGAIGHFGQWISTCFLMKKTAGGPIAEPALGPVVS